LTQLGHHLSRYGIALVQVPLSNGMWASGERITCRRCGKIEDLILSNSTDGKHLPLEAVLKKFKRMGWEIRGKRTTCPDCLSPAQRQANITRAADANPLTVYFEEAINLPAPEIIDQLFPTLKETPMAEPATAPAFTAPTRDQKRRIHDEIAGNWDEPRGRYIGNASDQMIADHLKLPRAWVAEIRSDFFGEEGGNEEMVELRAALDRHIDDVERLVTNAMDNAAKFDKVLTELKGMRSRLERIEKSVLPRR